MTVFERLHDDREILEGSIRFEQRVGGSLSTRRIATYKRAIERLDRDLESRLEGLKAGPKFVPVVFPAKADPRTCNKHTDCDAAEARAKEAGKPERYGHGSSRLEHCTNEDCEDCFGC